MTTIPSPQTIDQPAKSAPECPCEIGNDCTNPACCYYGCVVPSNVRSALDPGPNPPTREQRLHAALVEIERLSPKPGGVGQIARDTLRAYK